MADIRLVALDLDGTLLNLDGTISKRTIMELKRLYDKGISIGIATGRSFDSSYEILSSNGIETVCGYPHFMVCEERAIHVLKGSHYQPDVQNEETLLEELRLLDTARKIIKKVMQTDPSLISFVNSEFWQEKKGYVEVLASSAENGTLLTKKLDAMLRDTPLKMMRQGIGIKLRHSSIGKGAALETVVSLFNVMPSEVLVMGDSHNDWDMLSGKFRVATTQNADEEIKNLVLDKNGLVSASSYSDGVAEVLRYIV